MLINLRNALMAGKKWINPYDTGALLGMWDAEWNAGNGKHSDNLGTIIDASGYGMDAVLSNASTSQPSYANKGLVFNGGAAYGFTASDELKAAYAAKTLTIEIVTRVTGYASTNRGIISLLPVTNNESSFNGNPYWRIYADGSYPQDGYYLSNSSSRQDVYGQYFRSQLTLGRIYTITTTFMSNQVAGYFNGVRKNQYSASYLSATTPTGGWIGAKSGAGAIYHALTGCTIYDIRIHGKVLTADEIASTFAVDNERYGII